VKTRQLSCFQDFHCIAGACKDSCCIGWEIEVNEASFQRFQQVEGSFGQVLRSAIATEEDGTHHYILQGERCPFLNEQGLCRQILELGEEVLCEICAQHPRFYAVFGEVQEMGVGIACEEAARLLFSAAEPLTFLEAGVGQEPEDDRFAFLQSCREQMFIIAQNRELSIDERLTALLALGEQAQEQLEEGDFSPIADLVPTAQIVSGMGSSWLDTLTECEPIDQEWTDCLEDALAAAQYPELLEAFAEELEEQAWLYEHFLVYLLFRYGLKAYEDWDLLYWVQTAVFSCLTVEQLAFGRWLRKGQKFCVQDWQDVCRIFSKEFEYDPEMICALDELWGTVFAGETELFYDGF
jgi:lysine-N-methylase